MNAVKSLLPPKERRGLVLIDPPFEEKSEFAQLATAVSEAISRFATGTYLIWYPLKDETAADRFVAVATAGAGEKYLDVRLAVLLSRTLQENGRRQEAGRVIERVDEAVGLDSDPDLLVELAQRATEFDTRNVETVINNVLRHPRVPRAAKQRLAAAAGLSEPLPGPQAMALRRA